MTATAITYVRVFDGGSPSELATVVIDAGLISARTHVAHGDKVVDGRGHTLLPGLIDTHVHLLGEGDLQRAIGWGVTTMLDMGTPAMALTDSLRNRPGLPDIRSSGPSASAPGGVQITRMHFPPESAVRGPNDAARFVADRVAEGADYIKIIVEDPTQAGPPALNTNTVAALVIAAHTAGLMTIAHASRLGALRIAQNAGVDVVTHAPLDGDVEESVTAVLASRGTKAVPTLTMMRGVAAAAGRRTLPTRGDTLDYAHAAFAVTRWREAGITVIAGTDSNMAPGSPTQVPHGESMHDELHLLVDAGMSPAEALRAATGLAADAFRLGDRGGIRPGLRADLLLVEGDPLEDIAATRNVAGVWAAGTRVR
jgi:imidazolonepropionase-like amidohydrolase